MKRLYYIAVTLLLILLFTTPVYAKAGVQKRGGTWWYVNSAGKIVRNFKGFAKNSKGWWYLSKGKVSFKKNGIIKGKAKGKTAWWYVKKSKITPGPTVAKKSKNNWYYIDKSGKMNTSFKGFAKNKNGWWYLSKGKVSFKKTGVIKGTVNGETAWWYVKKSKVIFDYNGVGSNSKGTWYVRNGKVDFGFSGTATFGNKTYRVENGRATVIEKPTALSLKSSTKHPYLKAGASLTLTATVEPANALQDVVWSSADPSVATVDAEGVVTAKNEGTTDITAKAASDERITAAYTVTVTSLADTDVDWIAHRGYSAAAPENTRAAFELAAAEAFDSIECDVQMTRDGVFVLSHDDNLRRIFGVDRKISASLYEEIADLTAVGGNGTDRYPNERLTTLKDYMEILAKSDKRAVIELKQLWTQEESDALYDQIAEYGINDRVEFISFDAEELVRLSNSAETYEARHTVVEEETDPERRQELADPVDVPPVPPQMSFLTKTPTEKLAALGGMDAIDWAYHNGYDISITKGQVTPQVAARVRSAGMRLTTWTVDDFDVACYLAHDIGADAITSNLLVWK